MYVQLRRLSSKVLRGHDTTRIENKKLKRKYIRSSRRAFDFPLVRFLYTLYTSYFKRLQVRKIVNVVLNWTSKEGIRMLKKKKKIVWIV